MDQRRFDAPGNYTISVQGFVSQVLYDMIPDVSITIQNNEELYVSVIHVKVKDQSHLIGVLNILYDAHCVILSIKYTGEPELDSRQY